MSVNQLFFVWVRCLIHGGAISSFTSHLHSYLFVYAGGLEVVKILAWSDEFWVWNCRRQFWSDSLRFEILIKIQIWVYQERATLTSQLILFLLHKVVVFLRVLMKCVTVMPTQILQVALGWKRSIGCIRQTDCRVNHVSGDGRTQHSTSYLAVALNHFLNVALPVLFADANHILYLVAPFLSSCQIGFVAIGFKTAAFFDLSLNLFILFLLVFF